MTDAATLAGSVSLARSDCFTSRHCTGMCLTLHEALPYNHSLLHKQSMFSW